MFSLLFDNRLAEFMIISALMGEARPDTIQTCMINIDTNNYSNCQADFMPGL